MRLTFVLLFIGTAATSLFAISGVRPGAAPAQVTAPVLPPADITGKWHFVYQTDGGDRDQNADLKVTGDQVSGKVGTADAKGTFKDGSLELSFPYTSEEAGMSATLKMKGTLKDKKLNGTWQFGDYEGNFSGTRTD